MDDGDLEARCKRNDLEAWKYRALEARCKSADVEVWRYGALDAGRKRAECGGICTEMKKSTPFLTEAWSSRGTLWAWGRGDTGGIELRRCAAGVQMWRSGSAAQVQRHGGIEVYSSGGTL